MDRKLVLYVLLGIMIFALWEAWQRDYAQTSPQSTTRSVPAESQTELASPVTEGLPLFKPETESAVVGLPSHDSTANSSSLVKVTTDVMEMVIDLVGGNLVESHLLAYPRQVGGSEPIQLLTRDPQNYYVSISGLTGKNGPDLAGQPAKYRTEHQEYRLQDGVDELQVKLLWQNREGVQVAKIFTFQRGQYAVKVKYDIQNRSQQPWEGQFYAEIKRKDDKSSQGMFQISAYQGAAISSAEKPYEKISFGELAKIAHERQGMIRDIKGGWIAMQQRYFLSVWIPDAEREHRFFGKAQGEVYTVGLGGAPLVVAPGKSDSIGMTFYSGPDLVEQVAPLANGLDRTVDYGWLWIISVGLFWLLRQIQRVVSNWGVAIILITLLIKAVFYKFSESSCRSMARMKELMPKMQALKERYSDDKSKLHQATMELYRQEKVNPLNLGGCLPMLIQIPFFIALYYVLVGAVELRQAPFFGWITDLSVHDPYYLLPILMGGSMLLQQRLSPSSLDPTQAKMMMFMPVMFTALFATAPAGLVLYWLVNNVVSIAQQWYINRKLEKCPANQSGQWSRKSRRKGS